ncbi:NIPSNAP family protein [Neobittarella massiliensis]|uniref:NIPSNAP family protein n=2 Tax=Oscillospiraceae TaxID=216572 RepID=A0A8J6M021_9FIRM|nr:NIPSNAP family protein [Neobittarella massiliensis]MBC3517263.1 NIPSNAP family protein [Neobittarella massiliensis]SCJ74771.1 NIPSNAP [uncultured Anaerotruncus sp.]
MYELRIYHINPGKLDLVVQRFEQHTFHIFERLGIQVVDFWVDCSGDDTLYYIVKWADKAEMDEKWGLFVDDAEWKAAYADSEKDGETVHTIENHLMERLAGAPQNWA